ncbi:hypothetical protein DXG01_016818 [Tephrocybe rancida]|nr:hypothetical protein DXG01_016818 [Tephrocybe rancida]
MPFLTLVKFPPTLDPLQYEMQSQEIDEEAQEAFPGMYIDGLPRDFPVVQIDPDDLRVRIDEDQLDNYMKSSVADRRALQKALDDNAQGLGVKIVGICGRLIEIFSDYTTYINFLGHRESAARDLLDLLQKIIPHFDDRDSYDSETSSMSLSSASVENRSLRGGKHGEIFKSDYKGTPVCQKVIRLYEHSTQVLLHKISGIAAGIHYLHINGVVHGDLKSRNILVNDNEEACLTDFGFSYVTDKPGLEGFGLSSSHNMGGTPGFESPELVDPDIKCSRKTTAMDVWSFGMVCFEVFVGAPPFGRLNGVQISFKTLRGQIPERPTGEEILKRGLTDDIWNLMTRCWAFKPEERPTINEIIKLLPLVNHRPMEWTLLQRPGFTTSNGEEDSTITNALSHLKYL